MQIKTPIEITEAAVTAGKAKIDTTRKRPCALFVAAILAGAYIAIGGILSIMVGYGFPEISSTNPGLQRFLCGAMFPLGLILVVVLGAELFTGNNATLIPGYMGRHYGARDVITNWTIVYFGNLVGALFFTYFFVYLTELADKPPYLQAVQNIAVAKTSMPWLTVLLKGIGANWFVCLAVWLAMAGHSFVEKALACWLPVMAFVVLGYEHSIANMFYLPLGMMEGAPVTVGAAICDNIIPATIGNIIGGALFVGCLHTFIHRPRKEK